MQQRMKTKIILNKIVITIITILIVSPAFTLTTKKIGAAPFDQQPVPNYDPVTSNDSTTTATIPLAQVNDWRGLYVRPVFSLLGKVSENDGLTLKDYFSSINDPTNKPPTRTFKFNPASVYAWTTQIADSVNAEASEPAMKIENGRVTEFTPPQTGKALNRYDSTMKIIDALSKGINTVELVVHTTEPRTPLGSLNNLGIKELIGRGESKFNGSPANRRWNIRVGVEKMTGIIVKPGEEFSFNKYLGPVEAYAGFKPELVIKKTGTVPELGGGLCQVSSTTFRAAMHAGLKIDQRRNHSYAVQYYAPQGTDATIYPGVVDFKFTNDTQNSILIWPYFKSSDILIFDIYGTYDGRKVELGTPYSYDKKSDGSMKATWKRTVTKIGQDPTYDTFNSVYQPPALFHKEETFVPSTPAAGTNPAVDPIPIITSPPPSTTINPGNENQPLEPEQN